MKTSRFYSHPITFLALAGCMLSALPNQAQTFNGQSTLADSPKAFDALVFPISNRPSTIRVNFDNPTGCSVRVAIRDQKGRLIYDESEGGKKYRGTFNLAALPAGNYVVELSKRNQIQYVQSFTIESPTPGRIVIESPLNRETQNLVVN